MNKNVRVFFIVFNLICVTFLTWSAYDWLGNLATVSVAAATPPLRSAIKRHAVDPSVGPPPAKPAEEFRQQLADRYGDQLVAAARAEKNEFLRKLTTAEVQAYINLDGGSCPVVTAAEWWDFPDRPSGQWSVACSDGNEYRIGFSPVSGELRVDG